MERYGEKYRATWNTVVSSLLLAVMRFLRGTQESSLRTKRNQRREQIMRKASDQRRRPKEMLGPFFAIRQKKSWVSVGSGSLPRT